jgi:hypothetical protein
MSKMLKFSPQIRVQDTRGGKGGESSYVKWGHPSSGAQVTRKLCTDIIRTHLHLQSLEKGVFFSISCEGSLGEQ